jgi:hypothetical protein
MREVPAFPYKVIGAIAVILVDERIKKLRPSADLASEPRRAPSGEGLKMSHSQANGRYGSFTDGRVEATGRSDRTAGQHRLGQFERRNDL